MIYMYRYTLGDLGSPILMSDKLLARTKMCVLLWQNANFCYEAFVWSCRSWWDFFVRFCWHHWWHFWSFSYWGVLCLRIGITMIDSYVVLCLCWKSYKTIVFSQSKWRVAIFRWYLQCILICDARTTWWQSSIFCAFSFFVFVLNPFFFRPKPHSCPIYHSLTMFLVLPQF